MTLPRTKCISRHKGSAMIVLVVFLLIISITVIFGVVGPALADTHIVRGARDSRASYFAAESSIEDVAYRIKDGRAYTAVNELVINTTVASTTVTNILGGGKLLSATGDTRSVFRNAEVELTVGSGASFNFGVQSGDGGIVLEQSSTIDGNVYSNGPVSGAGNFIGGTVISAGEYGLINKIHASSSAHAHTIQDSTINGDAYYQVITGSTVVGTAYPGSPDEATSTLPIGDVQIEEWKQDAEDGGVITSPCPYEISSTETIGPVKIECDLNISGNNYTLTLAGNVWVVGNIHFKNNPDIKVDPLLGNKSVAVVADNPSDRLTSSKIILDVGANFFGSGEDGSYILLLSQNESAEQGGSELAISNGQSTAGDLLLYAGHGEIRLGQSSELKEVTAYRVHLRNSAEVIYESGLASLLFTSGPGGGYEILSWRETE